MRTTILSFLAPLFSLCLASVVPSAPNNLIPKATSCENTPTTRSCWGDYSIDTDYYTVFPETGVTREYWLSVEPATLAPDGYERLTLTFNGTIPGPLIWANWGDNVIIHVTNNDHVNGTSIHWHGIRQLNTVEYDGVSGVTQCPIPPGWSMTYKFQATQYGSTWYHSHIAVQYGDGLLGPLIINGPATANYDEDLGLLFLTDWSHATLDSLWDLARIAIPPSLPNGLVNGTNTYDCSNSTDPNCIGGGKKFEATFVSGTKYRIRVVNTAVYGYFQFSIDGHNFTVMANDMVPIVPYETDSILVTAGQRYDIVVEGLAEPEAGSYWLRSGWLTACSPNENAANITGIIRYDTNSTADPTTSSNVTLSTVCVDEPLASLVPYLALDVGNYSEVVEQDLRLDEGTTNSTWTINNSTLVVNWSDPTTLRIVNNDTIFPTDYNVLSLGNTNSNVTEWVVYVLQDLSGIGLAHPMHLHGHDFYVIGQEAAVFDINTSVLNLINPPRRDGATIPANGYLAIAFKLDNPGTWLMHCHIVWHASEGLALQFVENESQISPLITATAEFEEICKAWDAYVPVESFAQPDSGI